jgi:transcriptional regulator of acetoin/glycerol metabolism
VIGLPQVESLLIAPIFHTSGELMGIIQLMNKLPGEVISQIDTDELMALGPAMASLIETCNEVKEVRNVNESIQYAMV